MQGKIIISEDTLNEKNNLEKEIEMATQFKPFSEQKIWGFSENEKKYREPHLYLEV